jgi:hypothetical protein
LLAKITGESTPSVVRYAVIMSTVLGMSEEKSSSRLSRVSLSQLFTAACNYKSILGLAHSISELDDVLDAMAPEDIISLGEAQYGDDLSPFLESQTIRSSTYHGRVNRLVSADILPQSIQNSFSNIYAVLVKRHAQAALDYKNNNNLNEKRALMTKLDMQLAQATLIHVAEHFKGRIKFSDTVPNCVLSFQKMASFYPHAAKIGMLFEMGDHLSDFLTDIRHEIETGLAVPNWIATKLHGKGQLLNSRKQVGLQITSLLDDASDAGFVGEDKQPDIVRAVIAEGEKEYYSWASTLPNFSRDLMCAFWHVRKLEGMKVEASLPSMNVA